MVMIIIDTDSHIIEAADLWTSRMSKKKVVLTEDQRKRNAEILARLEEERVKLIEETRALQLQERRRPGRKRKKKLAEEIPVATD